jgi:hypothetical protein
MKAYLFCLSLLLAAAPAGAQVVTGTVEGTYGGGVANASVSIVNEEGVMVAQRFTDRGGRFTVHLSVGGTYRVRVVADEFQSSTRTVRVGDNGTATARVRLQELHASPSRLDSPRVRDGGSPPKERAGGAGGGKPGGTSREN